MSKRNHMMSFRMDPTMHSNVSDWMEQNNESFSQLANAAIRQYISEIQIKKPVTISDATNDAFEKKAVLAMQKHDDMLDKLK